MKVETQEEVYLVKLLDSENMLWVKMTYEVKQCDDGYIVKTLVGQEILTDERTIQ